MRREVRRVLALFQIIGGAMGLWLTATLARPVAESAGTSPYLLLLLGAPPFLFVALAGVSLWLDFPASRMLSVGAWLLQIPVLSTPTVAYFFNVGLGWRFMYGPDGLKSYLFLGSQIHASIAQAAVGVTIGVNAVALVATLLLLRSPRRQATPSTGAIPAHSA